MVADAVYAVPTPAPALPDTFVWAPSVPVAADYQIYARWTAGSDRASNAKYLIDNGTSMSTVTVNQRANAPHVN